jgi:hypothetical protein
MAIPNTAQNAPQIDEQGVTNVGGYNPTPSVLLEDIHERCLVAAATLLESLFKLELPDLIGKYPRELGDEKEPEALPGPPAAP